MDALLFNLFRPPMRDIPDFSCAGIVFSVLWQAGGGVFIRMYAVLQDLVFQPMVEEMNCQTMRTIDTLVFS